MSSYQFVNSLASSCYVGRGSGVGTGGPDLSGMSAADYYATAMSNYQNCYGGGGGGPAIGQQQQPQQHYADFGSVAHIGQHQQQQQQNHPQHSMPMSPMSNGGGVDFTMSQALHVPQQPMQQQQQQQPNRLQQSSMQQQQMRGPSAHRLHSVTSPVNLGMKSQKKSIKKHKCRI